MKINYKNFLSDSIIRTTLWNVAVIIGFYLLFNFFAVIKLLDLADHELDKKILHEIEHIDIFVDFENDSLIFYSDREFDESDFKEITANAYLLQIYDKNGKILFRSKNLEKFGEITLSKFQLKSNEEFSNEVHNDIDLRCVYKKMDSKDDIIIQLATFRSSTTKLAEEFELYALITFPIILILILITSLFLSRKAYSNINKIIDLANEISASNLSQRIVYKTRPNDVLAKLRDTLNELFNRLENQVSTISEFTNNASHQLMSPLTAIKSEIEYLLKKERGKEEYINSLSVLGTQNDKLISITKSLLILAKGSNHKGLIDNVFSLSKLVETDLIDTININRVIFEIEENIFLRGNSEYFSIALYNLIENGLKYSNDEQKVIVKGYNNNNSIIVNVIDSGIGISDKDKSLVFDKFYRGTNSYKTDGFGLGLSLVSTIIKQMQGTISVKNNTPTGTVFELIFPAIKMEE
ncbi:MAG: HAMP domain-containing sensor histidine kinase [Ignavibacteria bacterium]|nr:HAMP domain-containing sensor histidine kinase [Ignavibacteria bacterium]